MKTSQKIIELPLYYGLIGFSLLYFFIKGIQYILIGSPFPLIFVSTSVIILVWSFYYGQKVHRRVLNIWAIIIMLWATTRLSLSVILYFDMQLTESHLREQFGLLQQVISILMLSLGILIIKRIRLHSVSKQIPGM